MDKKKILRLVIPFNEIDKIDDLSDMLRKIADEFEDIDSSNRTKIFTPSIGYIEEIMEDTPLYKRCNDCNNLYEATTENFYKYNSFPGLYPVCIHCFQKKEKDRKEKRRKDNEDSLKAIEQEIQQEIKNAEKRKSGEVKICNKCKKQKSIKEFYRDHRNEDGLNTICKTCEKERKQKKQIEKIIKEESSNGNK